MNIIYLIFLIAKIYTDDNPICILGSGITGLVLGNELKSKGNNVIIFEKQDYIGGKILNFKNAKKTRITRAT